MLKDLVLADSNKTNVDSKNLHYNVLETVNGVHEKAGGVTKRNGFTKIDLNNEYVNIIGKTRHFFIEKNGDIVSRNTAKKSGKIINVDISNYTAELTMDYWDKCDITVIDDFIYLLYSREDGYRVTKLDKITKDIIESSIYSVTKQSVSDLIVYKNVQGKIFVALKNDSDVDIFEFGSETKQSIAINSSNFQLCYDNVHDVILIFYTENVSVKLREISFSSNNLPSISIASDIYEKTVSEVRTKASIYVDKTTFECAFSFVTTNITTNNVTLNLLRTFKYDIRNRRATNHTEQSFKTKPNQLVPTNDFENLRVLQINNGLVAYEANDSLYVFKIGDFHKKFDKSYIFGGFTGIFDSFYVGKKNKQFSLVNIDDFKNVLSISQVDTAPDNGLHFSSSPFLLDGINYFVCPRKGRATIKAQNMGIQLYQTNVNLDNQIPWHETENEFYIGGSLLKRLVNNEFIEVGFTDPPEIKFDVAPEDEKSTAELTAVQYNYFVVFERIIQSGQREFSQISNILSTTRSTNANFNIILSQPQIGNFSNTTAKLYANQTFGSTPFLIDEKEITGKSEIEFAVNLDVDIELSGEVSYITSITNIGLNLQSIPICYPRHITDFNNRIVVTEKTTSRGRFLVSTEFSNTNNYALAFNIANSNYIETGQAIATNEIDGYLYIFTSKQIYSYITQGSLTQVSSLSNIGLINEHSITNIAHGTIIQSVKGIYLFTRGQSFQRLGLAIKDYENNQIIRSINATNDNRVYLFTSSGQILVLNTEYKNVWTTYQVPDFIDVTDDVEGNIVLLTKKHLLVQNEDHSDNGKPVFLTVKTGWCRPEGRLALQKIKEIQILGQFNQNSEIGIRIFYDFDDDYYSELFYIVGEDKPDKNKSFAAINTNFSKIEGENMIRFKPERQRCTAFRVEIYEKSDKAAILNSISMDIITSKRSGTGYRSRR